MNQKLVEDAGYQSPTTGKIGVVDANMPWDAGAAAKGELRGWTAFDCGTSTQPRAVGKVTRYLDTQCAAP